jgi:hypothetical protein
MAYTTIDDPSAFFQTALYTGNATNNTAITFDGNSDMQPDWLWSKNRASDGYEHHVVDSVRGVNQLLRVSADIHEFTSAPAFRSFNSDGFTLGENSYMNVDSDIQVMWGWKAGTSFTNDASSTSVGTIDSAGSISADAGFSIMTYTGTGSNGTVAHGLSAIPKMIIIKNRTKTSGDRDWAVYHQTLGNGSFILLNSNAAKDDSDGFFNATTPTSSVFSLGDNTRVNASNDTYVAYCFAEKQGHSKFGSYTGNGNADGTFVYLGFKPAFILRKRTDSTGSWLMQDNKRPGSNRAVVNSLPTDNNVLYSNTSDAELYNNELDILSNGFKLRATDTFGNGSGATYIYMAFAENPLVTSTGVPATAR